MTLKLSPAMETVLKAAYPNATAPIHARTNTIVALIDRKLVTKGSEHYLTDDGLRAAERLLGLPISGHSVHVDDATADPSELYNTLVQLFATDPSEALYRAEEELPHDMFMTFVDFATNGTTEADAMEDAREYDAEHAMDAPIPTASDVANLDDIILSIANARDPRESMIHIGTWRQSCASVGCDGCPQDTDIDTDTFDPRDEITDEEAGADTWMIDQINHNAVRAEYAAEYAEMAHAAMEAEADAYHATMIESQDAPEYVNAGPAPVMSTGRGAWHGEHRRPMSVKSREAAKRRRKAQRQARKAQRRTGR